MKQSVRYLLITGALFLSFLCQSKTAKNAENFQIGIAGDSYRAFTLDRALQNLEDLNVKFLSATTDWLPLDATEDNIATFKRKCQKAGVETYALGPIRMKTTEDVDVAFDYAVRFDADMLIGIPDYDLLEYVIGKIRRTGIKLLIHTQGPDASPFQDVRVVAKKVKDPSLGIGCCMDLGNSARMGRNVARDIVKYKDWIWDIHIKDVTSSSRFGKTCELGRGKLDVAAVIKSLKKIHYTGKLSLEYEKDKNNPHLGIAESIGYLRGVIAATK